MTMDKEIIIRLFTGTDGICYDVYVNPENVELPDDSDDGGICTSGWHVEGCQNDYENGECPPGCDELQSKPYSAEDWKNALGMAVDCALDEIKRAKE